LSNPLKTFGDDKYLAYEEIWKKNGRTMAERAIVFLRFFLRCQGVYWMILVSLKHFPTSPNLLDILEAQIYKYFSNFS